MNRVTLASLFQFTPAHVERGTEALAAESAHPDKARASLSGFVAEKAAEKLNEALNTDLFELFAVAWLKFKQVRDCADRAKHPADEEVIVTLHDVEITSTNTPLLRTTIAGVSLPELRFTLELTAKFKTLQLVIKDARIRSLRPGAAEAIAKLKYGSANLAQHPTTEWKLPGEISCGDGIPIPSPQRG